MRIEVGGAVEESAKANVALFQVFPLMFLVMLTLLMLQLQSFSTLFLVFSTAPLGIIGASFSLLAFNAPFGFVALLGLIALAGMIMRNTVILVDQIDADVASGLSLWDAIIESTVRRSRPLVLTALAAILAMIPLTRSVFWGPMAITMMGGLLVATILTLLFVPALYAAWFRVRQPEKTAMPLLQHQEASASRSLIARWCPSYALIGSVWNKGSSSKPVRSQEFAQHLGRPTTGATHGGPRRALSFGRVAEPPLSSALFLTIFPISSPVQTFHFKEPRKSNT